MFLFPCKIAVCSWLGEGHFSRENKVYTVLPCLFKRRGFAVAAVVVVVVDVRFDLPSVLTEAGQPSLG